MANKKLSNAANKPTLWIVIAVLSLVMNVGFIGFCVYVAKYNDFYLYQASVTKLCNEPGYSRVMHNIALASHNNERNLKFAAASMCFTDYATGKTLDVDSLKPQSDGSAHLPASPK